MQNYTFMQLQKYEKKLIYLKIVTVPMSFC